jgi:hypothetical protein
MLALVRAVVFAAVLLSGAAGALAQNSWDTPGGANANGAVSMCLNASSKAVPCSDPTATPLRVSGTVTSSGSTTANQGTAGTNANSWWMQIGDGVNGPVNLLGTFGDGVTATQKLGVWNQNYLYNGSTSSIWRDIAGALNNGFGTAGTALVPHSAAAGAIIPVVSTAAEASHVLKASAGNFYSLAVTAGASAGYVLVFNAISAPADGAVTPVECIAVAANATVTIPSSGAFDIPVRYSAGITAVFSTTGCFTKTASTTAFFSGKVQ